MFGGLGMWEIILIFLVALLLFGAKRLPEIGSSLGKGIREFKSSVREIENEVNRAGELPREGTPEGEEKSSEVHEEGEPRRLTTEQ